jgi:hypothetical protein
MPKRLLAPAAAAVLLAAAPAHADTTTILEPPARSPVTIPGSGVDRGEALSDGQVLVRRRVDVRAGRRRLVTLRCPGGTTHAGLGVFEGARIGFGVIDPGSYVGRQTVRLRAFAAPGTPRGRLVRGSIFALCEGGSDPNFS